MTSRTGTLVVAVDLGATSGRVILARVSGDGPPVLDLEEIARFPNEPVQREDGLHWNIAALHEAVLEGLADARVTASRSGGHIASIGIDSWAVDYAVLRDGELVAQPFHYRDGRNARGVERVHSLVPFEDLYARNGLQFLPFNTMYQFAADPLIAAEGVYVRNGIHTPSTRGADVGGTLEAGSPVSSSLARGIDADRGDGADRADIANGADGILLIPDLFAYWLTGVQVAEETNASTTGFVPAAATEPRWDAELVERVGVPAGILPPIVRPGDVIGTLTADAAERTGLAQSTPVVAVGSHDTASAVVGTPLGADGSVFVSCGTWGLVGVESPTPVLTTDARDSGFTNERGVDGTTRLLHNVMGLWVLNECVRAWGGFRSSTGAESRSAEVGSVAEVDSVAGLDSVAGMDLAALLDAASGPDVPFTLFDIDDPRLLPPGDMPARVERLCREAGGDVPRSRPEFVRSIVESLADAFARAAAQASALLGAPLASINVVGGGARNALLCQTTADRAGVPVIAGPVEATAIGNVLVQARAAGAITGGLAELRALVAATQSTTRYEPR
ncbi:rhamnulokinase family protein [Humibacter antri]